MREPANTQKLALAALGAALLVPLGLVGIWTGLDGLSHAGSEPGALFSELVAGLTAAAAALAPWCEPMICLLFGLTLLSAAILLLARGLQSTRS